MAEHLPVLLEETLDGLSIRPDGLYVDATFGRGGHSQAILDRLDNNGRLIALDRDPAAIAIAEKYYGNERRFTAIRGSFGRLHELLEAAGATGGVNGMLFDLGVSSPQVDEADRGFSFAKSGPLDMRMDPDSGQPASEWINNASEKEIADVIRRYGEERYSRRIARRIVAEREQTPLANTARLADLVAAAVPRREPGRHPATRTFQAIRIHVNDELGELEKGLEQVPALLGDGGRLCVISFHSLEDRMVKRFMRRQSKVDPRYAGLPDVPDWAQPMMRTLGRPVRPGADETQRNPRSRSAVLRIAEKRSRK